MARLRLCVMHAALHSLVYLFEHVANTPLTWSLAETISTIIYLQSCLLPIKVLVFRDIAKRLVYALRDQRSGLFSAKEFNLIIYFRFCPYIC